MAHAHQPQTLPHAVVSSPRAERSYYITVALNTKTVLSSNLTLLPRCVCININNMYIYTYLY